MTRTAYDEAFGCSLELAITADALLPAPGGIGGVRLVSIAPDVAGAYLVRLPDARACFLGTTIVVHSLDSFELCDNENNGLVTTAKDAVYECFCVDRSTMGGVWRINEIAGAELHPGLTIGRQPWEFRIDSDAIDFDLHAYLMARGYDDTTPVAIRCTIGAGVTIGESSPNSQAAFSTGVFPTGSSLFLVLEAGATITGCGGNGGGGGSQTGTSVGVRGGYGGVALRVEMNTSLVSYGYIQGGGGGGGGGAGTNTSQPVPQAGGGGGGGAGHRPSYPGPAGPGQGGSGGITGVLFVAGGGGAGFFAGGAGGGPGQAGTAGGSNYPTTSGLAGAGGAAGDAVQRATASTLTKIVAGSIVGAETTF